MLAPEHPVVFLVVNGFSRAGVIETVRELPLGTHKVVIAPIPAVQAVRARFHAMCGDLSRQAKFAGAQLSLQQWKVLAVSGHAVAQNQPSELISGLENELVDIRESTTQMSNPRLLSCVEYVRAWGDMRGVRWTEPRPSG